MDIQMQHAVNLLPYNTFQVSSIAEYFIEIKDIVSLQELITSDIYLTSSQKLIIGGGSNILFTKKTFDGLIIKNSILGKKIIKKDSESVTLRVGGGENRNRFVLWSVEQGYCGAENLVSIPGSVGAAPIQNIGAYGVEVASILQSVECVDLQTGEIVIFDKDSCNLGYRHSNFKTKRQGQYMISHCIFSLEIYSPKTYKPHLSYNAVEQAVEELRNELGSPITPSIISQAIATIRSSKLPDWKVVGTAGSFFKNPIIETKLYNKIIQKFPEIISYPVANPRFTKLSAGQLIDLAGCKGISQGPIGTYKNHALIIVNNGGGTGDEIIELATRIQKIVFDMFGVGLIPEVNYVE